MPPGHKARPPAADFGLTAQGKRGFKKDLHPVEQLCYRGFDLGLEPGLSPRRRGPGRLASREVNGDQKRMGEPLHLLFVRVQVLRPKPPGAPMPTLRGRPEGGCGRCPTSSSPKPGFRFFGCGRGRIGYHRREPRHRLRRGRHSGRRRGGCRGGLGRRRGRGGRRVLNFLPAGRFELPGGPRAR